MVHELTENAQNIFSFTNLLNDCVVFPCQCLLLGLVYFDGLVVHDVYYVHDFLDVFRRPELEHLSTEPRAANLDQIGNELLEDVVLCERRPAMG